MSNPTIADMLNTLLATLARVEQKVDALAAAQPSKADVAAIGATATETKQLASDTQAAVLNVQTRIG